MKEELWSDKDCLVWFKGVLSLPEAFSSISHFYLPFNEKHNVFTSNEKRNINKNHHCQLSIHRKMFLVVLRQLKIKGREKVS